MSFTNGQLIGAVIGTAVGFFTFNPAAGYSVYVAMAAGASLGMTIGGIVDPPPQQVIQQEGPRLGDLNVQTAEWGRPIPRLFGTYRLSGNVIWSLPLHETKHEEESGEGKGGGGGTKTETTWYTYAGSWAVGFCEGEVSGIAKIWFDSVLVYDGYNYDSGLSLDNHTVYLGTSNQEINWYMDDGNTPAYRNLAYIVFRGIELENYGNKIPKVSVEWAKEASSSTGQSEVRSINFDMQSGRAQVISLCPALSSGNYSLVEDLDFSTRYNTYVPTSDRVLTTPISGILGSQHVTGWSDVNMTIRSYSSLVPAIVYTFDDNGVLQTTRTVGYCADAGCNSYLSPIHNDILCQRNDELYQLVGIYQGPKHIVKYNKSIIEYGELPFIDYTSRPAYSTMNVGNNFIVCIHSESSSYNISYDVYDMDGVFLRQENHTSPVLIYKEHITKVYIDDDDRVYILANNTVTTAGTNSLHRIIDSSYEYIDSFTPKDIHGDTINTDTNHTGITVIGNTLYLLGIVDPILGTQSIALIKFGVLTPTKVPVSSISEELFLRAGLESADFDVTEGTDLVNGYVVPNPMQTRSAIASLISAYAFELVETNSQLFLKKRDTTSISTVAEDKIIDNLEIKRIQSVELSKKIDISYANKDNNYDIGTQSSMLIDSNAESTKAYQFPLALSDQEGKRISELYLYSEWNERLEFTFSLTSEYFSLIPSNVITLQHEGIEYNVRLTKVVYESSKRLNFEASLENTDVYTSTAEGSDTGSVDYTVYLKGLTNLLTLDIPMLDNLYNHEGIYISAYGTTSTWEGCSIHKSIGNELSYNKVGDILNSSITGLTSTLLGIGPTTVWDLENSVKVFVSGNLYEKSTEEVLRGENYILIGNEILQYKNAQFIDDGEYILSGLLRGRRGTEWAIGTHSSEDRFVLLSNSMIFDSTATLGVDSYYKGTTFGTFIEDTVPHFIRPNIVCLKPFAPAYLIVTLEPNNDITITWTRRSRDVTGYLKKLQLFEAYEMYSIDISNGTRVETSLIESFVYTDAMQIADNYIRGSYLPILISQVSDIVGNGYEAEYIYSNFIKYTNSFNGTNGDSSPLDFIDQIHATLTDAYIEINTNTLQFIKGAAGGFNECITSTLDIELNNDFSVEADVEIFGTLVYSSGGLFISNLSSPTKAHGIVFGGQGFSTKREIGTYYYNNLSGVSYVKVADGTDGVTKFKVRIERSNGEITRSLKEDGGAWVSVASYTNVNTVRIVLSMSGADYNYTRFDNLILEYI